MNILIVEDEKSLADEIAAFLRKENFLCEIAYTGVDASEKIAVNLYDFILLDLGLPDYNGLDLIREARNAGSESSFIIITARGAVEDKVKGLDLGADDYLAKPFQPEEMLARVEVLIRRASGHATPLVKCGPIELDPVSARVTLHGKEVNLTAQEYRVLQYLIRERSKVISRAELCEHIYGTGGDHDSNVIEVVINHLRNKLEPSLIRTRRGLGYQMQNASDEG